MNEIEVSQLADEERPDWVDLDLEKNHYVKNKPFYAAMVEYKDKVKIAEQLGLERPPVTDYMARCFLQIATHLGYRFNFARYSWKDEMIMDAVEDCIRYAHNFNTQYKFPFSYFNRICWEAFKRRIKKEKRQQAIKGKLIVHHGLDVTLSDDPEIDEDLKNSIAEYVLENSYYNSETTVVEKKEKPYVEAGVELFMGDEDGE